MRGCRASPGSPGWWVHVGSVPAAAGGQAGTRVTSLPKASIFPFGNRAVESDDLNGLFCRLKFQQAPTAGEGPRLAGSWHAHPSPQVRLPPRTQTGPEAGFTRSAGRAPDPGPDPRPRSSPRPPAPQPRAELHIKPQEGTLTTRLIHEPQRRRGHGERQCRVNGAPASIHGQVQPHVTPSTRFQKTAHEAKLL